MLCVGIKKKKIAYRMTFFKKKTWILAEVYFIVVAIENLISSFFVFFFRSYCRCAYSPSAYFFLSLTFAYVLKITSRGKQFLMEADNFRKERKSRIQVSIAREISFERLGSSSAASSVSLHNLPAAVRLPIVHYSVRPAPLSRTVEGVRATKKKERCIVSNLSSCQRYREVDRQRRNRHLGLCLKSPEPARYFIDRAGRGGRTIARGNFSEHGATSTCALLRGARADGRILETESEADNKEVFANIGEHKPRERKGGTAIHNFVVFYGEDS
jgi:hypothetical protein